MFPRYKSQLNAVSRPHIPRTVLALEEKDHGTNKSMNRISILLTFLIAQAAALSSVSARAATASSACLQPPLASMPAVHHQASTVTVSTPLAAGAPDNHPEHDRASIDAGVIVKRLENTIKCKSSHAVTMMTVETPDYKRSMEMESWWVGKDKATVCDGRVPLQRRGDQRLASLRPRPPRKRRDHQPQQKLPLLPGCDRAPPSRQAFHQPRFEPQRRQQLLCSAAKGICIRVVRRRRRRAASLRRTVRRVQILPVDILLSEGDPLSLNAPRVPFSAAIHSMRKDLSCLVRL